MVRRYWPGFEPRLFQALGKSGVGVEGAQRPLLSPCLPWAGFLKKCLLINLFWLEECSKGRPQALLTQVRSSITKTQTLWHLHFLSVPPPDHSVTKGGVVGALTPAELRHRKAGFLSVSFGFVGAWLKLCIGCHRGFVGAEGSRVGTFPEDVEGDVTFGPRLINLTRLSSSPGDPLTLSEEGERQRLVVYLRLRFFFFFPFVSGWRGDRWVGKSGRGRNAEVWCTAHNEGLLRPRNYRARPMTLISVIYCPLWLLGS